MKDVVSSGVSVCTIVRGRRDHLVNLIEGLNKQSSQPLELVVAYMQDEPHEGLPATNFPIINVHVAGLHMPLAAARNCAAKTTTGSVIVFLDVDCIPSRRLIERYYVACSKANSVMLSEVYYLSALESGDPELFIKLNKFGVRHPAKPALLDDDIVDECDHGQLWGLAFGLERSLWALAGGMDESYYGYGAEETDFGLRLKKAGIGLAWLGGARAYHQHHTVHIPPYQHFEHIIRNANLFFARWGIWCMDYWIDQFINHGLVEENSGNLTILRDPSHEEIQASRQADHVLFS